MKIGLLTVFASLALVWTTTLPAPAAPPLAHVGTFSDAMTNIATTTIAPTVEVGLFRRHAAGSSCGSAGCAASPAEQPLPGPIVPPPEPILGLNAWIDPARSQVPQNRFTPALNYSPNGTFTLPFTPDDRRHRYTLIARGGPFVRRR